MSEREDGRFDIGDGWLAYEVGGNRQGETVVFSHAGFLDSRMFDAQWAALANRYHLIRYDMRGFGRSSNATAPICRRADPRNLLEHLGVEHAHFVGCSMGGEIVLDLALETPGLATSVTLIGTFPSGFVLQGKMPRYLKEMMTAVQAGNIDLANELQIRIWFDGPFREPDQVDEKLRQAALEMNRIPVMNNTHVTADMVPDSPLQPPAAERLAQVACRALVMVGALDDPELLRAADVLAKSIPGARNEIIEETAHVPSFEKPERVNRLLQEFLAAG